MGVFRRRAAHPRPPPPPSTGCRGGRRGRQPPRRSPRRRPGARRCGRCLGAQPDGIARVRQDPVGRVPGLGHGGELGPHGGHRCPRRHPLGRVTVVLGCHCTNTPQATIPGPVLALCPPNTPLRAGGDAEAAGDYPLGAQAGASTDRPTRRPQQPCARRRSQLAVVVRRPRRAGAGRSIIWRTSLAVARRLANSAASPRHARDKRSQPAQLGLVSSSVSEVVARSGSSDPRSPSAQT